MKQIPSLLISEPPLQALPSLATAIGLNEALVLQQIHYWIRQFGKERDGQVWIYNTYQEWQEQFPFWSIPTIKRIVESLRKQGLVVTTGDYNKSRFDRTLWYSIDYCRLRTHVSVNLIPGENQPDTRESINLIPSYQETSPETTSETTNTPAAPSKGASACLEDFERFWESRPRRGGDSKAAALKAWKSALKRGHKPEALIAGQEREKAYHRRQGTEPRFIPMRSTWLNQDRHLAEYDDAATTVDSEEVERRAMKLAAADGKPGAPFDDPEAWQGYLRKAREELAG